MDLKAKHHTMQSFMKWWINKIKGRALTINEYIQIEKKFKNGSIKGNNTDV